MSQDNVCNAFLFSEEKTKRASIKDKKSKKVDQLGRELGGGGISLVPYGPLRAYFEMSPLLFPLIGCLFLCAGLCA